MKEGLELIPRPEQSEWAMTGEYFASYLVGVIKPLPVSTFPERLDFSVFTPVFDRLYHTHQEVYFHNDEDRARWHADIVSRPEPINEAIAQMREREIERIDKKVPGERYIAMYVDLERAEMGNTDIIFGKKDSVEFDTRDLIVEGKIPFASVHTHPEEYLPSPQDVSHVLTDYDGEGLRQIKSGIVLLPGSQVLFVATDQTLALTKEQTKAFVQKWSERLHKDPRVLRYQEYVKIIQKKLIAEKTPQLLDEVLKRVSEIGSRKDSGEISEDEMKMLIDEALEDHRVATEQVGYRLGRDKYIAGTVIERRFNQVHQEMLKEAGVKVYVSYDRAHYTHVEF